MQSQRFALQELLKQFLLVYHYCTSSFLFVIKSAKPALCQKFNVPLNFTRIAKAILVGVPLLYKQFVFNLSTKGDVCQAVTSTRL